MRSVTETAPFEKSPRDLTWVSMRENESVVIAEGEGRQAIGRTVEGLPDDAFVDSADTSSRRCRSDGTTERVSSAIALPLESSTIRFVEP